MISSLLYTDRVPCTAGGKIGCLFSLSTGTSLSGNDDYITILYNKDAGATSPFFCMVRHLGSVLFAPQGKNFITWTSNFVSPFKVT